MFLFTNAREIGDVVVVSVRVIQGKATFLDEESDAC